MKKVLSLSLVLVLSLIWIMPFCVIAVVNDDFSSLLPNELQEYSEAYIDFSLQLENRGVPVNISIEEFVSEYSKSEYTIEKYTALLVEREIVRKQEYEMLNAENNNNDTSSVYASPTEKWYDSLGYSNPVLPQKASYSKYNLLSVVKKGDIIIETEGTLARYTGHAAFVQGIFYDSTYKQYYIRTIEAGAAGVVYGVVDDTRYDDRRIVVYDPGVGESQINDAIGFLMVQLGKGYWVSTTGTCKTSINSLRWYCTELVWAAYYWKDGNTGGVNLYDGENGEIPANIYMPLKLATSRYLVRRTVSLA